MNSFVASEAALLEVAVETAGVDDFGLDEWRDGFRVLLASLDDNTLLTELGRGVLRQMIVRDLVARLVAQEGFRQHPESANVAIDRPLVIIGLPRTGTTALQEMLSLDPQFQGLELWLTRAPKPRPARSLWIQDAAYQACDQSIALIREYQPDLYAIHKMEAGKVDECWNLMAQSFAHSSWLAQTQLPAYRTWFDSCDMRPVYARHRRNLQLIGVNQPGTRWMLKDSTHLFALDAFLDVYPDACVVQTHRDPVSSIASVCSLCWAARRSLNDGESRAEYGPTVLDLWHAGVGRTLSVRRKKNPLQFFDVSFENFRADPSSVIEGVYDYFGFEFDDAMRSRLAEFRMENPALPHRYTLEDWGLHPDEVVERFADYSSAHEFL